MITIWYNVLVMTNSRQGGETLARAGKAIPLYVQLAQLIRQRIYAGHWNEGDTLPSEQAFGEIYAVSQETVRNALSLLRGEGLVVTGHGIGSRVARVPRPVHVAAGAGDTVRSRMPTPAERARLEMPEGVPLVVLTHPDGGEEVFDSLRTRIVFGDAG